MIRFIVGAIGGSAVLAAIAVKMQGGSMGLVSPQSTKGSKKSKKKPQKNQLPESWDNSQSSVQIRRRRIDTGYVEQTEEKNDSIFPELEDDTEELFNLCKYSSDPSIMGTKLDLEPITKADINVEKVTYKLSELIQRVSANQFKKQINSVQSVGAANTKLMGKGDVISLVPNKVYLNGKAKDWDTFWEVKFPPNQTVEIEFGTHFYLSNQYRLVIKPVPELSEKFALRFAMSSVSVNAIDAQLPLILKVRTADGGYVSKNCALFHAYVVEQ